MTTDVIEFTVTVPGENDPGYVGFLDDMMQLAEVQESETMTPQDWRRLMSFLEGRIDSDDSKAVIRSMSLPQLKAAFDQIAESIAAPKKS